MKWIACYEPQLNDGEKDPSKLFNTKKDAIAYVVSRNCKACKKEGWLSGCSAEWLVMKYKDFKEANGDFIKLLEAGGYKRIK